MSLLLPDAGLLFWTLLSFVVVLIILTKFGFPAITSMIDERKRYIDESLQHAREANKKLADIEKESAALLKAAHEEQAAILREAAVAREQLLKEAREKAGKEGEKMLAETRRVIQMEKEEALRDIRRQVAELSIAIAEKVLSKELADVEMQNSVIEKLVEEAFDEKA
ncbi:MAG: F0F1 ATP synthase subunit B [Bacteroidaceae bacterium]|nr:F0F1 ATP synthase subunit B [Bacteroidaceae bacterium]MBQ8270550.1 F0F1 ATP synthase subunit B [Bacteroidaceae bacterium]